MPFVLPFIAIIAAAGLFSEAGALAAVGLTLMLGAAVGGVLVLGEIAKLFNPQKGIRGPAVTTRQPIAPRQVIYGLARVGGIVTFMDTTGTNNKYLQLVITLTGHEVNAITNMYFDGHLVALNGSGDSTALPWLDKGGGSIVHAEFNLGTRDQAAFAGLISTDPSAWNSNRRQRGCAGVYVRLLWNATAFANGIPNITFDVQGRKVYDPRSGTIAWSQNAALCAADYMNHHIFGLGAQTKYPITAAMLTSGGTSGAFPNFNASQCVDNDLTTKGFDTNSAPSDTWIQIDLGSGNAAEFRRFRVYANAAGYANTWYIDYSDDGLTWHLAVDLFLPNVAGWNEVELAPNGAHRYWGFFMHGAGSGTVNFMEFEFYSSDVDSVQLTAAANTCDELVFSEYFGANENRFTVNGSFTTDSTPGDVITRMNSAMAGTVAYVAGLWGIYPGIYRSPTISLSDADLRAPLKVQTRITHRSLYNGVRGSFISPANNWQPTDFPPYSEVKWLQEDNLEQLWLDVQYAFTVSPSTAQRLSKIALERQRRQITLVAQCKISAYQAQPLDTIQFTHPHFGWANKTFEVLSTQLVYQADASGKALAVGVDLSLRETDSTVFNWTPATDESPLPVFPVTVMPQGSVVQPPTNLVLQSVEVVRAADGVKSAGILLTWTAPADQFVIEGGKIVIQYKGSSQSNFQTTGTVDGTDINAVISPVQDGTSYDVQIYATNSVGASSTPDRVNGFTPVATNFLITSGVLDPQGSIIPAPSTASPFTTHSAGTGNMYIQVSWIAQTVYRPDGSTIAIPASSANTIPAAPTLSNVAGGTRVAESIWAAVGLVKNGVITGVSAVSTISCLLNNTVKVSSPSSVAGYDGWVPFMQAVATPLCVQNGGATIAFGTDWTEPATHFINSSSAIDIFNVSSVFFLTLSPGTAYTFYPYWDGANVQFSGGGLAADSFTRANGAPGASWTAVNGTFAIVSNAITCATVGGDSRAQMYNNTITPSANQFSQITVSIAPTALRTLGVAVRSATAAETYYAFYATSTNIYLFKVIAGILTVLSTTANTPANGDVMRLEVAGTALTAKINGITVLTAVDASIASGQVGIISDGVYTTDPAGTTWSGGSLAGSLGGANSPASVATASTMFLDTNTPLAGSAGFTVTTPSSGGSGSGGGGGCVMIGSRIFPLAGSAIGVELPNEEWILLEAGDHVLICTPDHPVISEERGKTRADQLRIGEILVCDDGGQHLRRAISLLFKGTKEKVVMSDGHLFWANGILSHNHKP